MLEHLCVASCWGLLRHLCRCQLHGSFCLHSRHLLSQRAWPNLGFCRDAVWQRHLMSCCLPQPLDMWRLQATLQFQGAARSQVGLCASTEQSVQPPTTSSAHWLSAQSSEEHCEVLGWHMYALWTRPSKVSMPWPTDTAWRICLWALPAAVSEAGSRLSAWTTVSPCRFGPNMSSRHRPAVNAMVPLNTATPSPATVRLCTHRPLQTARLGRRTTASADLTNGLGWSLSHKTCGHAL